MRSSEKGKNFFFRGRKGEFFVLENNFFFVLGKKGRIFFLEIKEEIFVLRKREKVSFSL